MPEPIALVGTACRFPGSASSPSKLWDLLRAPRDVLVDFPPDRLNLARFDDTRHCQNARKHRPSRAYLLEDDPRLFDAAFFRISPKEAHAMDPQQRMLLETVYEALEAAGIPLDVVDGSATSVHVGVMTSDYNDIVMRDPDVIQSHTTTGVARSLLSNRISYFFNLRGPSLTIDTACSSSLVAVHQAVQGLRSGDANQAIIAGSGLLLDPAMFLAESKLELLSPDSRSRMWDRNANGYARGEGCAAIILKPLSAAIRDNDHIQCIIRNTGVNQDGRTNGITVPSSSAQAELIRKTYATAGLDVIKDRCQFFECHGTGTLTGDPVEARAIQETFFPDSLAAPADEILYCGSVKTVIGHLEGCAGIAGLLKASLAIQHKQIPPNMHFEQLNPAIEPYYNHLSVPTSLLPWPETHGGPLRVSLNSFGLGGTNSHIILESYDSHFEVKPLQNPILTPNPISSYFVFSAKTKEALLRVLRDTIDFISTDSSLDLEALSWSLQTRRSSFPVRTAVVASTHHELLTALETRIGSAQSSVDSTFGVRPDAPAGLLGIFTGQGAQWPTMGRHLMQHCRIFRDSLTRCQNALASLIDPPSWVLMDELAAGGSSSRISEAQLSQPLCTAVQIALVDLLAAAGVGIDSLVGHSSGEIGVAYSAGLLTTKDAMGIAYYRGLVSHQARGFGGQQGGMMAVGVDLQSALAFCNRPQFNGRIWVAASNGPSTVTLSGDIDAILEAKGIFDADSTFARQLKVDIAYHSPHMRLCVDAYTAYLKQLDIQVQMPRPNCKWFSSVYEGIEMTRDPLTTQLRDQYWIDNLTSPVLFSQALDTYWSIVGASYAIIEIGPHPALKGPVTQTLKRPGEEQVPYSGCLERGANDVEAMTCAVVHLWKHLRTSSVDFTLWRNTFDYVAVPKMIQYLPSYPWDHQQVFWSESRRSHNYRLGSQPNLELLGSLWEDCETEMVWRNFLSVQEFPWLRGHSFQGQCLFPGAGYVAMVVQAATPIVRGRSIKLIEVQDMEITKAMVIEEDGPNVETMFTIKIQHHGESKAETNILYGAFVCHFSSDQRNMDQSCQGRIAIHLDVPTAQCLPPTPPPPAGLTALDVNRFYKSTQDLGIQYDGVFRSITSIQRIQGQAMATASWSKKDLGWSSELHPAVLDTAFQAGFATFASIAEGAIGCTFLPAGIRRIVIDLKQQFSNAKDHVQTTTTIAHLTSSTNSMLEIDLDVFSGYTGNLGIQIDGLMLKAVAEPLAVDDRKLFAKTVWDSDISCGLPSPPIITATQAELEYIDAVERTALFYLQDVSRKVPLGDHAHLKPHHKALLDAIPDILRPVKEGCHKILRKEWLDDKREVIENFAKAYPDSVDLALLRAVGENLPTVINGESEMLEHMLQDDLLGRLYKEGRGFTACNEHVANIMRTICHKYPRTKILEIGAGTGGTTQGVLAAIGKSYKSYTYTDLSAGYFEKAAAQLADHSDRLIFKTFNIEESPSAQGFAEGTYDVVIAANVLHATRKISETMHHARSMLRPGGFLIVVEVTGNMLRETGLMGGLEGWWLGRDDGRFPGPGISTTKWHHILRSTGFSGIETVIYDMPDIARHNCSVFYSHAVSEQWEALRDPLAVADFTPPYSHVVIVGGTTLPVAKAVSQVERLLRRFARITLATTIDDVMESNITPTTSILCLAELDKPVFAHSVSRSTLESLQEMLSSAQSVLWVTRGRRGSNPYANMMIGIGRALAAEAPHVQMQFLDLDTEGSVDEMWIAATSLLRMIFLSSPTFSGDELLWMHEPEVELRGPLALIPRVVADDLANDRLNSRRRQIKRSVSDSCVVQIVHDKPQLRVTESRPTSITKACVQLVVRLSIALHLPSEDPCFLCFGHVQSTGRSVFALSHTDCSTIIAPRSCIFEPIKQTCYDEKAVASLGACIIAGLLLRQCPSTGTILVFEPTEAIADAISAAAQQSGQNFIFVTSDARKEADGWTVIHPLTRPKSIRRQITSDAVAFVQMSDLSSEHIVPCLPKSCLILLLEMTPAHDTQSLLSNACEYMDLVRSESSISTVSINDIAGRPPCTSRLPFVVEWSRRSRVEATISPIPTDAFFASDKTFFLAGMTGELGQSLCRFMARCGARYFVLASRNPALDALWMSDLKDLGVKVLVVVMDVTDRERVAEVASDVRRMMPPIAGVANGALVLEDSFFVNTTAEGITKQLMPKVTGTQNLHDEFASDNLDFFIVFSSLGSVYGNAGQSVYHAANMFMTSLIEKRQRDGLAGSVMHVGMISDVGYVAKSEREGRNIEEHLRSQFYAPLAESDFHEMVLQAVLCGRPGSKDPEVIMGVQHFLDDQETQKRPPWYDVPRMSHLISSPAISAKEEAKPGATSVLQVRQRFENAETVFDAEMALRELLCKKLELIMMLPPRSVDTSATLGDHGLDSWIAVELRNWFLKDMHIEISLLTIMGRESISTICHNAAESVFHSKWSKTDVQLLRSEPPEITLLEGSDRNSVPNTGSSTPMSEYSGVATSRNLSTMCSTPAPELKPNCETLSITSEQLTADQHKNSSRRLSINVPELTTGDCELTYSRVEPMSYAQASMFFLGNLLNDRTTFNVTAQYHISGSLNVPRFTRALEKTLCRHETFRTSFFSRSGSVELRQGISSSVENLSARLSHIHDLPMEQVSDLFQLFAEREWALDSGQTFQAALVTHTPNSHSLVLGCHHIVMDGMSWHIFFKDLDRAYQLLPPDQIPQPYADFAVGQHSALKSDPCQESLDYWLSRLEPPPLVLPLLPFAQVKNRKPRRSYGNNSTERKLSSDLVLQLRAASQACQATPMQFCLAVMQTFFALSIQEQEICIGVVDSGRTDAELYQTIGQFSNLLPMRFSLDATNEFTDIVQSTKKTVLEGLEHAIVPFDKILEALETSRPSTHAPLFQVAFNYRIGDLIQRRLGDCTMNLVKYDDAKLPYDVTFIITESSAGHSLLEIVTNDVLYSPSDSEMIADMFVGLLEAAVNDPSTKVQDMKAFNQTQSKRAISLGRGARVTHDVPKTLIGSFRQACLGFPDDVAIIDSTASSTYQELSDRVKAVEKALLANMIVTGSHVAVLCEPSIDTYAAMLAILSVGAVYVPLDLSLPTSRHRAMIAVCKPSIILYHQATTQEVMVCLDDTNSTTPIDLSDLPKRIEEPAGTLSTSTTDYDMILFTSGSTGTPKAIKLSQAGIMNYAGSKRTELKLGRGLRVLQQSSTGFDMSIAQAFNAFVNSGTLVVVPSKARGDPVALAKLMLEHSIEFTLATPSEYSMLASYGVDALRRCRSWKHACSGGETVTEALVSELKRLDLPELVLTNCYGPTEISCAATFHSIRLDSFADRGADGLNSVGKAISNTSIYVVDDNGNILPPGMTGELCIGGAGIAKGYHNEPESQSAKFVVDPYATIEDIAHGWHSMYKTGDLACLRGDGSLVFLGRRESDSLIKFHGLRIDLDEIATMLLANDKQLLAEVVVTVRGDFLVAHVVPVRGTQPEQKLLNAICHELPLPQYMHPSRIIAVRSLPRTANGKIDRRAIANLALPNDDMDTESRDEEPLTVVEGELRLIWIDALSEAAASGRLYKNTDFFQAGGSSLTLIRLQHAIKEKTGANLALHELYQNSTLCRMAAIVGNERSQVSTDHIDWVSETSIPDALLSSITKAEPHSRAQSSQRRKKSILLTGATSFLGSEMLKVMLADQSIEKIHCIAVPETQKDKLTKLADDRICVYIGSLLSDNLGLSNLDVNSFKVGIDIIIHAGAQGHCLNNYSSVRKANFHSTQFLATSIALEHRIPLHFISSSRVILQSGAFQSPAVSMGMHPPPTDGSQGFTASKWASEKFLENFSRATGLSVFIHRTCSLIGDQAPHDDAMNSIIRFSRLSHSVPEVPQAEGFFDFRDVTEVAKEIGSDLSTHVKPGSPDSVVFRHHSSGVKLPFVQLSLRLSELYGREEFEVVSLHEWISRARGLGIEELIVSYLEANVAKEAKLIFPYLGD